MIFIKYRILDSNGDMTFGKGQQNLTYGSYAVAQAIQTRLKLLKGEWFEDKEDGLPLFQNILAKYNSENHTLLIDSLIKKRIAGTKDVLNIEQYSSSYSSVERKYSFNARVNTLYGTISISNTL